MSIPETLSLPKKADFNTIHSFVMPAVSKLKQHRTQP